MSSFHETKKKGKINFPYCLTSPSRASAQRVLSLGKQLQYVKLEKKRQCRKIQDILSELKFRHHFGIKKGTSR